MMHMKKIILTFALLLSSHVTFAASATPQQVEKLFTVTQVESLAAQTLLQLKPQLQQQAEIAIQYRLQKSQLNSQEQAVARQLAEQMYQTSLNSMSWSTLKPLYIQAYQDTFSAQEIQAQIKFYESEVGQSILNKSPALALRTSQITNQRLAELLKQAGQDFAPIEQQLKQLEKK